MLGEEEKQMGGAYYSKPLGRMAIILAGPVMNNTAILLFSIFLHRGY